MNAHYLQHYRILGVQPGCSFRDLKYAYRRLVKNWHPDHFTVGHENGDLALAESRIKEINKAFRALSNYYKKNGRLPLISEETASPDIDASSFWPDNSQASNRRSSPRKKTSNVSVSLRFLIIGAALGLLYVAWDAYHQEEETILDADSSSADPAPVEQPQPGPSKQQDTRNYFSEGSTLGDVIAIQGVPTSIEGFIWHYGKSKVYFENGVVDHWSEDADDPLKVNNLDQASHEKPAKSISIGTTKQNVRIVQGAPLRETKNMWEYRISRIYFKDDKVTGWYDSPLDPLKIRK